MRFVTVLVDTVLTAAGGYVVWAAAGDNIWPSSSRIGRIGLPAWTSGLSFGSGLFAAGSSRVTEGILNGQALHIATAAFAVFLVLVLSIQRQMRLSIFADSFGAPQRLVQDGVFRYSRNPIYVAFLIPLASIAYVSVFAAAFAAGLYIVAMNVFVIRAEERELLAVFGAEYSAYRAAVPRWFF